MRRLLGWLILTAAGLAQAGAAGSGVRGCWLRTHNQNQIADSAHGRYQAQRVSMIVAERRDGGRVPFIDRFQFVGGDEIGGCAGMLVSFFHGAVAGTQGAFHSAILAQQHGPRNAPAALPEYLNLTGEGRTNPK